MRPYIAWVLLACTASVAGCDIFGGEDPDPVATGVYVINQGDFGSGNGSVTVYDPVTGTAVRNAVSNLNSTLQSLYVIGGRGYLTADTGGRIDILDLNTNLRVGQITGLVNPRYMIAVSPEKGYVTNLYGEAGSFSGGKVTILNLSTNEISGTIPVGDNPEGMALHGNRLYVANSGFGEGTTLSVINVSTDEVTGTIDLPCDGPRMMFVDNDAELFVVCTGRLLFDENWNVVGETEGKVVVLDAATGSHVTTIPFDGRIGTASFGQDAFFVPERAEAYVVAGRDVVRISTASNTRGTTVYTADEPVGAVAYDATSNLIYVSTIPSFTESGTVHIRQRDGTPAGSFQAGIGPSFITFRLENQ